jgi:aspartyl-tRNA(Asn)/glutamyl-tRNA(Gln) amidotransferase subunit C
MSLTPQDVLHIARLARLRVSHEEAEKARIQLNSIFNLIEQMQSIDTRGIEPMSHALDVNQRLREDFVTESDSHEKFQSIAPAVENGLYLVPKVIE